MAASFPERFGCKKDIQNKIEIIRRQYKNMGKYCQIQRMKNKTTYSNNSQCIELPTF